LACDWFEAAGLKEPHKALFGCTWSAQLWIASRRKWVE